MSNQIDPIESIPRKEIEVMLRNAEADHRPPIRNFKNELILPVDPSDLVVNLPIEETQS